MDLQERPLALLQVKHDREWHDHEQHDQEQQDFELVIKLHDLISK